MRDPSGLAHVRRLGARSLPVVAREGRYVIGQDLDHVAEFVGLPGTGHTPLPPARLAALWIDVLRAAQRYVRQMPAGLLSERPVADRDRSTGTLAHHVFRVAEAFLDTVTSGGEYAEQMANLPPPRGVGGSAAAIAEYGDRVLDRLETWRRQIEGGSCRERVVTYYGPQTVHQLLERSTWHSAQHVRQLIAVLDRCGIEPDGRLTTQDLAGLPLPERLFE
jgi:hypothetical protein